MYFGRNEFKEVKFLQIHSNYILVGMHFFFKWDRKSTVSFPKMSSIYFFFCIIMIEWG